MITKSDLQSFLQCPRKLWLEHKLPDLMPTDDPTLFRQANDGSVVGVQVAYLYAVLDLLTTPQRKAELENKLRIYCRQDTWAMVEVAHFLAQSGRPARPPGM